MADYNSTYARRISKRPLYITVGPPCAGKTTFLKSVSEHIYDVTIDDQEGVYWPIDTQHFLVDHGNDSEDKSYLRQTMLHNVSLENRIYGPENDEMRKVLQHLSSNCNNNQHSFLEFLNNQPNFSDMQSKWQLLQKHSDLGPNNHNSTWAEVYDRVVKEFIDTPLPEKVDLFVLDGIFKTSPVYTQNLTETRLRKPSGLNAATTQLKRLAHSRPQNPIAWGNTNTKPRDYITALEIAESSQRPVYFVVYHNSNCKSSHTLPLVTVEELFRRNILRLIKTGRYIPCRAILDASVRVDNLVHEATSSRPIFLDAALAKMAGFHLHTSNRTVSKIYTDNTNANNRRPQPPRRRNNSG